MGTITTPSGISCGVSAPDQVINSIPNLRPLLSKSLDVMTKARKTTTQAQQVLDKQITTVKSNPQRYTPQALQQCTVNLDKAAAANPGVDVLESLTNTGYMPPEADVPISGGTATGAASGVPAEVASALSGATALTKQFFGGETNNNVYATTFQTPSGNYTFVPSSIIEKGLSSPDGTTYLFTDVLQKDKLANFLGNATKVDLSTVPHSGITSLGNSWGDWVTGRTGQSADGYLIKGDSAIIDATAPIAVPTANIGSIRGISKDEAGNLVYAAAAGHGSQYINAMGQVHDPYTTYHSMLGDLLGVDPIALQQVVGIGLSFAAPVLGEALAVELGTSAIVGNALASTALQVASGKDLESALKSSITNAVASGATAAVAGEISDAARSLDLDPKGALVGAAGAALLAGVKTTLQGGTTSDIANSMVAGAAGGATAAETGSLTAGGAVAGGLTGGTMGALSGAASGLGQTAAAQAAQARSLGIPLPPGGKVGVTWSIDGSGNALVMYEDGTTGTTTVPVGTAVGSTISVDPNTNVAQVTSMAPVPVGGSQVAGPGGMSTQTVASMPEMQPRQGETAGDVTLDSEGVYSRTMTYTQPDGSKTSYTISYDPASPSGQQIFYPGGTVATDPEGNVIPSGGGTATVSYTRPGVTEGGITGSASALPPAGVSKIAEAYKTFAVTGQWPPGVLNDPDVIPYVNDYKRTGQWSREVFNAIQGTAPGWQRRYSGGGTGVAGGGTASAGGFTAPTGAIETEIGPVPGLETFTQPAGAAGGTAGIEVPSTTPQGNLIPDQFGQVSGGVGTRDRQIMDLTGITEGGGGAGGDVVTGGEGGGGKAVGTGGEVVAEEKPAEEITPKAAEEPARYLVSGGVSPRIQARAPSRGVQTALQTPFTSSLITSGLTSYRGAGEIESPESGKRRSNVWNEASLRLKDALGI